MLIWGFIMTEVKKIRVKNGKVEALRFVFCISVLLFHAQKYIVGEVSLNNGIHLSLFPHGAMGVEFFFILSGFFMAKSIYKSKYVAKSADENDEISFSKNSLNFLKKKYFSIFSQHIVAFVFAFISLALLNNFGIKEIILKAFDSIPNFLLIQMSGINFTNPNHIEWYISCMLIAMAIIYPICSKYYYNFTRCVAPVSALLILGYMIYTTNSLTGVTAWTGLCYKSLLRAIAEIALGTTAFELSRYWGEREYDQKHRIAFTLIELICFAGTMMYILMTFKRKYEVYTIILLFLLISIVLSGVSYGDKLFNNKVVLFLGKMSLPIYLGQITAINLTRTYLTSLDENMQIVSVVIITLVLALFIMLFGNIIDKLLPTTKK